MNENPFVTPRSAATQYYALNFSKLSLGTLWRLCRARKLTGILLTFPMLLILKLFFVKTRTLYGMTRPEQLTLVADESISEEVYQAFAPYDAACGAAGMTHVFNNLPDVIGARTDLSSVWIAPEGNICAATSFVEVSYGTKRETLVAFVCTTWLDDGTELQTTMVPPGQFVAEAYRPENKIEQMPHTVTPEEIISRHKQRIAGINIFVYLTEETVKSEYLRSYQLHLDYVIEKKLFRKLSPMEVESLQRVDPIAQKSVLLDH